MRGRRTFLRLAVAAGAIAALGTTAAVERRAKGTDAVTDAIAVFLCGDVMTGRAIDQILPHPSPPELHEPWVRDARRYLELAEEANGAIPRPAPFAYIWGDALDVLDERKPDLRIINLETSVTRSSTPWPGKGIHYRMHPGNAPCLTAASIDACVLANNHVLDWGRAGLAETLASLQRAGIRIAGAGAELDSAQAPATLVLEGGTRVLVFAAATDDAGAPAAWAAGASRSGIHRLADLSPKTLSRIVSLVRRYKREGDVAIFSLHWGDNWGYEVSAQQRAFAHGLIDEAGVDVVHGHSSHHPRTVEVFHDRLILYGCGDFLNDYEGIEGNEEFRGELGLMYFPSFERASGRLLGLRLVPTRVRSFRVERAARDDRRWLLQRLQREYRRFGCDLRDDDGAFELQWGSP